MRVPVGDGDGRDSQAAVVEHDDRISRDLPLRPGGGNLHGPHQGAGVRHAAIEGHHVQVEGVAGQDALDEVRGTGKRSLRVDRRLSMECRISGRSQLRGLRSAHADGRERPAGRVRPHTLRVQEQAREIPDVVDVEVGEKDSLQAGEVETGFDVGGRGPSSTVDHEDPLVDHQG